MTLEAADGSRRSPLSEEEQERVKTYAEQIVEAVKVGGIVLAM